jgi:hypothetical protein
LWGADDSGCPAVTGGLGSALLLLKSKGGPALAILTMFRIRGDPDELLAVKKEKIDPIVDPLAIANGAISHTVAKTGDGLLIVNVWEGVDGMQKVADEAGPQIRELGVVEQQDWQQFEVVQRRTPGA